MAEIRCETCGVILIDSRRKRLRSCAHYPLIVEQIDDQGVITIGTGRNGRFRVKKMETTIDLALCKMIKTEAEIVSEVS